MNFKQKLAFFSCGCFSIVLSQIGLFLANQWVYAQDNPTETVATVPQLMNYQGFLSQDGLKLNETVSLTFSIYDVQACGTALWTEIQPQVIVQNGLFNVLLGNVDSLTTGVFEESELYLGIEIDGSGQELSPRQRLTSVAYAFNVDYANYAINSANAEKLGGFDISSFMQGQIKMGLLTFSESNTSDGVASFTLCYENTAFNRWVKPRPSILANSV